MSQSVMFTKLPTELVCLILSQLDNLQDLYSVISASTFIYNVFKGTRCVVLNKVIRKIIRPEAMPDALFTLRARDSKSQVQGLDLSLAEAEQLCHLWHSHDYFIKGLIVSFKSNLNEQLRLKSPEAAEDPAIGLSKESLSPLEVVRIQRAMFRYSAFQAIINDRYVKSRTAAANRVADLAGHHTPWEIEEVGCIHQHILNRLYDVLIQVEDYFIDSVQAAEQQSASRYLPSDLEVPLDLESEEAEDPFFDDKHFIFTKSRRYKRTEVLQYLSSLGLPSLRGLIGASPDLQKRMYTETYDRCHELAGLTTTLLQPPPQVGIFKDEQAARQNKSQS
jgi:hypothetical protein